jgi:predicted RNase H-like nuclease (RuvC/YqgF family)
MFASDRPENIIREIKAYPDLKPVYEDIYEVCLNVEKVMGMFSKELKELDDNTVDYMIDEMQDKIDSLSSELQEKDAEIKKLRALLAAQKNT